MNTGHLVLPSMWTLLLFLLATFAAQIGSAMQASASFRYVGKLLPLEAFMHRTRFCIRQSTDPIRILPATIAFFAAWIGRLINAIYVPLNAFQSHTTLGSYTGCSPN